MTDALERELRILDTERPLPQALYGRLEAALLEDAEARAGGSDAGDAALFDGLDAPRPIPQATRVALERALRDGGRRRDRRSVALGVAAAVLLVVGSAAALRAGGSQPSRQVALDQFVQCFGAHAELVIHRDLANVLLADSHGHGTLLDRGMRISGTV